MSDITRNYTFGEFFKEYRKKNGITLRGASRILKMDCGNLSKWEQSRMAPPKSAVKIKEMGKKLNFTKEQIDWLCERAWSEILTSRRDAFWCDYK